MKFVLLVKSNFFFRTIPGKKIKLLKSRVFGYLFMVVKVGSILRKKIIINKKNKITGRRHEVFENS